MTFTGSFEDRTAIRELHETYADAGFRKDGQAWLDCWAEDGVWITSFGEMRGKEALAKQWDMLMATMESLAFFPILGAIEVDGDRAVTRGYVREIFQPAGGAIQKVVGRYDDELVRENGSWRFARREYTILIRETGQ